MKIFSIFILVDFLKCSHDRARDLYAESIISTCSFTSVPCDSYENFQKGKCKCSSTFGCASMGYKANLTTQEGTFYLDTNGKEGSLCKN